jgi:hypothetical protein
MTKLIHTLLLGLLCLNLPAQTTPIELLEKQSIAFIQKQLFSNYPIFGEAKDVKKWLKTYSFRRYEFQLIDEEPCHFFKPKVDSFLSGKLTNWTSFHVQCNDKQPQKLNFIVSKLNFETPEFKENALLKLWVTLDSLGLYEPDDDVKTGLFGQKYNVAKYTLKEGFLIIETSQDKANTDVSIGFKLNANYGTASGLQRDWLKELTPIPSRY